MISTGATAGSLLPLVAVAAGCAGTGQELERLGELAQLPGIVLGPVAAPGDRWAGWAGTVPTARGGQVLHPVPGGVVHRPAAALSAAVVAAEVLPWWRARGLRAWINVRGSTAGALAEALAVLRRSEHFPAVAGIEVDLTAAAPPDQRVAVGGQLERHRGAHSADPDRCRRMVARVRELTPRGLPLLAKLGLESPDPLAAARAAVAGGASGLLLIGTAPVDPLPGAADEGRPRSRLAGPAVLPLTEALVARVRTAIDRGRVPVVPVVAAGGVHDPASARALLAAGALGVQVGTAVLGDPALPWRLAATLRHDPGPDPEERTSS